MKVTLINCNTRKLEQQTSTQAFMALSYVWGVIKAGAEEKSAELLPHALPLVIEDTIHVCKMVDISYL